VIIPLGHLDTFSATGTFLLIYGILGADKPDSMYRALVIAIMTGRAILTYKIPHIPLLFVNYPLPGAQSVLPP